MRSWPKIVMLAILACILSGLRPPTLSSLPAAPDTDERIAVGQGSPAALCSFRAGRPPEAARKAPLLAVLPSCPCLDQLVRSSQVTEQPRYSVFEPLLRSRSSRGPPALG